MQAVILCGGQGLRMQAEINFTCKPLVKIGDMPVLQHIMRIYKKYGITQFILCLGYQGEAIKEYFLNLDWKVQNLRLQTENDIKNVTLLDAPENWDIIFADTGPNTMTGGRIKKMQKYIDGNEFMLTYGDGVCNVNLQKLLEFHRKQGKIATVTGVRPRSRYGIMEVEKGLAVKFQEKPFLDGWVNGGYFVLNRQVFDYLEDSEQCVWEDAPMKRLIREQELAVYQHDGFWFALDTPKDVQGINAMWDNNDRPWI